MPAAWAEKLKKHWANTRLGHEAVVLEKLQRDSALVRRLIRKTQDGTVGKPTTEPEDAIAEGDMGVAIGNEVHYHFAERPPVAASEATAGSPRSLLAQATKLLALMAGMGGAVGAGAYVGSQMGGDGTQPPAVVQASEQQEAQSSQPAASAAVPVEFGIEVEKARQSQSIESAE